MNRYRGGCHCGRLQVEFRTQWRPEEFPLAACRCSFCRKHGARTTRDPHGSLVLDGEPSVYRFGLGTADFLLCPECGVYVAARLAAEGREVATLNVNVLEVAGSLRQEAAAVEYGEESREERVARRLAGWMPFQSGEVEVT